MNWWLTRTLCLGQDSSARSKETLKSHHPLSTLDTNSRPFNGLGSCKLLLGYCSCSPEAIPEHDDSASLAGSCAPTRIRGGVSEAQQHHVGSSLAMLLSRFPWLPSSPNYDDRGQEGPEKITVISDEA